MNNIIECHNVVVVQGLNLYVNCGDVEYCGNGKIHKTHLCRDCKMKALNEPEQDEMEHKWV